jgi:hypothetical protein
MHYKDGRFGRRLAKLSLLGFLLVFVLVLQVFLIWQVKHFIAARQVHDIRIAYNQYEVAMYGNNVSNMEVTVNGKYRGLPQFFHPELFGSLPEHLKAAACRIPFSQPTYFFTILLIWTVTCLSELKRVYIRFTCLVLNTDTCADMTMCFDGPYSTHHYKVIHSLSRQCKVLICSVVFLPRICVTVVLLWLGCRWLAATNSFGDLILNCMALECILMLKELIYNAMAPIRSKLEVEHTMMLPVTFRMDDSCMVIGETMAWGFLAVLWVYSYVYHFQTVLPSYQWDVHEVCAAWIAERFSD